MRSERQNGKKEYLLKHVGVSENVPICVLGYFCHFRKTAENVETLPVSIPQLYSCWIPVGPACRPQDSVLLRYFSVAEV